MTPHLARASIVILAITTGLAAQSGPSEFAVASVKKHTSDDQREMMVAQPGGRFLAVNTPLRMVIRTAYQVQDDQIVGAPGWVATERYDIDARADAPGPPGADLINRLQHLLADRFKLAAHRDTRELPVYALVRVKAAAVGPKLRETECPDLATDLARPQRCANISSGVGSLTFRGIPFEQILTFLAPQLNRVIVNRTGLTGRYDVDLSWTPDPRGAAIGPDAPARDPNAVSLVTALEDQLGLKLDATRAAVPVVVVDSIADLMPN